MNLFGMDFYEGSLEDAVWEVVTWAIQPQSFRVVVTPNLQHLRMIHELEYLEPEFLAKYRSDNNWHLADGKPIQLASKLKGGSIDRISGSDFLPRLLEVTQNTGIRVAVLGATDELMSDFLCYCAEHYPSVIITNAIAAPANFDPEGVEAGVIAETIKEFGVDILLCGLGFPKQEKFLFKYGAHTGASVGVAIGAAIEFLVERKQRAPLWMQTVGAEWLHRAFTDRRLIPRYGKDIAFLPKFVAQLIK